MPAEVTPFSYLLRVCVALRVLLLTDRAAKVSLCIFNIVCLFADGWIASNVALTCNIATLMTLVGATHREDQEENDGYNSDYDEQSSKNENAV